MWVTARLGCSVRSLSVAMAGRAWCCDACLMCECPGRGRGGVGVYLAVDGLVGRSLLQRRKPCQRNEVRDVIRLPDTQNQCGANTPQPHAGAVMLAMRYVARSSPVVRRQRRHRPRTRSSSKSRARASLRHAPRLSAPVVPVHGRSHSRVRGASGDYILTSTTDEESSEGSIIHWKVQDRSLRALLLATPTPGP